ncbi:MAG: M48 family metallopeptidase [Armatimonadota bacterium]
MVIGVGHGGGTRDRWDVALEKAVGSVALAAFEGAAARTIDPLLLGWLDGTVSRIAPPGSGPSTPRHILIESAVANAWTLPGGTILVTRGLLEQVGSDDALAAVLAHEASHVRKRHAWRQLSENGAILALLGLVRGLSREVRGAAAIVNGLRALAASRAMETDADSGMVSNLLAVGIDPRAIEEFLGVDDGPGGVAAWLSTHPGDSTRRRRIEAETLRQMDAPALAQSYERRGQVRYAAALREGHRPVLPAPPPSAPDPDGKRAALAMEIRAIQSKMRGGAWEETAGGTLRNLLLFTIDPGDMAGLLVSSRAWIVQQRVVDLASRIQRTAAFGLGTWDRLEGASRIEKAVGRGEVEWAIEAVRSAVRHLETARRGAGLVLANSVFRLDRRIGRPSRTTRLATQMGLLQAAEHDVAIGERRAEEGWSRLSKARIRAYGATLGTLAQRGTAADALARRWFAARLGTAWGSSEPLDGALRRAVALAAGMPATTLAGSTADVADEAERAGVARSVALMVRLLVLDLERELA